MFRGQKQVNFELDANFTLKYVAYDWIKSLDKTSNFRDWSNWKTLFLSFFSKGLIVLANPLKSSDGVIWGIQLFERIE